MPARVAVIGAGWAGLAAAVRAVQSGFAVEVFEMAPSPGGRARTVESGEQRFDNGQHILIGAYVRTLALMSDVGVDLESSLQRRPLELQFADGRGLRLRAGPPAWAIVRAIGLAKGWSWSDRLSLLRHAWGWRRAGFACDPAWTVDRLCAQLPASVREMFIDPLCVAALNTAATQASAAVFLRVMHDALLGDPGSADLLLPRVNLGALLPAHAKAWLAEHGAHWHAPHRVMQLAPDSGAWLVDGKRFDAAMLACSSLEASRLVQPMSPAWASKAAALDFETIVTVYLDSQGSRLPAPMMVLAEGDAAPAQFLFDHELLGVADDRWVAVVSGANRWLDQGAGAITELVVRQAQSAFGQAQRPIEALKTITERRATFRCLPALDRPPTHIAPGLAAAGDYLQGPYPATLEGAVRSGEAAARSIAAALDARA